MESVVLGKVLSGNISHWVRKERLLFLLTGGYQWKRGKTVQGRKEKNLTNTAEVNSRRWEKGIGRSERAAVHWVAKSWSRLGD